MAVLDYVALLAKVEEIVYLNESSLVRADRLKELLTDIIDSNTNLLYNEDREYEEGMFCAYDDGSLKFWMCIAPTTGAFAGADWSQVGV